MLRRVRGDQDARNFLAFLAANEATVLALGRHTGSSGHPPASLGEAGRPGQPDQPDQSGLGIVHVNDEDGPLTPFFTRRSRLRVFLRANPQLKSLLVVPAEAGALFRVTVGSALVVNPNSRLGFTVPAGVVEGILDTMDGAATLFRAGRLEPQPSRFVVEIGARLEQVPGVRTAYLGWVHTAPGPRRNVLVVVGGDPGNVLAAFGGEDEISLPDGRQCVVLPNRPGAWTKSSTRPARARRPGARPAASRWACASAWGSRRRCSVRSTCTGPTTPRPR